MAKRHNVFGSESEDSDDEKAVAHRLKKQKKFWIPGAPLAGALPAGALEADTHANENTQEVPNTLHTNNDEERLKQTEIQDFEEDFDGDFNENYKDTNFGLGSGTMLAREPVAASLQTSLFESSSHSIGLSIMKKMGFSVGDSLGEYGKASTSALVEPIPVARRENRAGLGQPQIHDTPTIRGIASSDVDSFQQLKSATFSEKHQELLCKKLMKLCYQMANEDTLDVADVNPLWRQHAMDEAEARRKREFHSRIVTIDSTNKHEENTENSSEEEISKSTAGNGEDDPDDESIETKITKLLTYLRNTHSYCYFCGINFVDAIDLNATCPGVQEADHEYALDEL